MNLPLFIAKRTFSDQGDRHKVSRPAIRIATVGVAIGLAVMIITVSVVMGFKHTIRDKVVGFGSHIQVIIITARPMATPMVAMWMAGRLTLRRSPLSLWMRRAMNNGRFMSQWTIDN